MNFCSPHPRVWRATQGVSPIARVLNCFIESLSKTSLIQNAYGERGSLIRVGTADIFFILGQFRWIDTRFIRAGGLICFTVKKMHF